MTVPVFCPAIAEALDPTPSWIASQLTDGSLLAWRHQAPFYGALTTKWVGQPKPLAKRFALMVHHLDCLLMRMRGHWSCELMTNPVDGDPIGISVTAFNRAHVLIPVEVHDRTIKIGGGEGSITLASNTAGRQILERACECIGVALGRRVGRRA